MTSTVKSAYTEPLMPNLPKRPLKFDRALSEKRERTAELVKLEFLKKVQKLCPQLKVNLPQVSPTQTKE